MVINVILLLEILLFLFLIIFFYYLLLEVRKNKILKRTTEKFYESINNSYNMRQEEELQKRLNEGNQEKENILYKLDLMIEQSGMKKVLPFLNTELFLIISLTLCVTCLIVVDKITGNWIFGFIGFLVIAAIIAFVLNFLTYISYNQTEKELIKFMKLIGNFSNTANDDILKILANTYPRIKEPLRSCVEDCYYEALSTGNISLALLNLETRVEQENFKDVIRNLEICHRHDANYKVIISDMTKNIKRAIKAKKRRAVNESKNKGEILFMYLIIFIMFKVISGYTDNMYSFLFNTPTGKGLVIMNCIIAFISFCKLIKFEKR